jgi:hypothetical protein
MSTPWVYVCSQLTGVTASASSSVTAVCSSGAWVQVPPPLAFDSTAFANFAEVTVFAFLAAYAVRIVVRLIWRP